MLGPDHPDTLATRYNIVFWTGLSGDGREALRLAQKLLPDQERVLGPDHRDTLKTRSEIAAWTAHSSGHARRAFRLFLELLPDRERVLGADDPDTLATRAETPSGPMGDRHARAALRCTRSCCRI